MDKTWFEMKEIRKRRFAELVMKTAAGTFPSPPPLTA